MTDWQQLRLDAVAKCLADARWDLEYAEANKTDPARLAYVPRILKDIARLKAMLREHAR